MFSVVLFKKGVLGGLVSSDYYDFTYASLTRLFFLSLIAT